LEQEKIPFILIADDDDDDCMLTRDAFNASGAIGMMHFVNDGIELMNYLSCTATLPDLILLDLNMPRKNGRQALKEIRSVLSFQNIPVVILTTSQEENDIIYCREEGADSVITKPASFSAWVKIMTALNDKWLKLPCRRYHHD
jgi:CheY-like chemotaxis protein